MSNNLPFEIQVAIIERLNVESLIRFRSVSKSWKSLIDSSRFIIAYHRSNRRRRTEVQHLLVRYEEPYDNYRYVSILDNNAYPLRKVHLTPPLLVNKPDFVSIVGSSHGLLCLRDRYTGDHNTDMVCLWNITIRKEVGVVVPNGKDGSYVVGFGVCRETLDPKIVKIAQIFTESHTKSIACIPRQVEVFTLSTGFWRSPCSGSSSVPRQSIQFSVSRQVIDGILYWLATDVTTMDGEMMSYNLIISFDLTSEEFGEISLPESCLALGQHDQNLSISKLKESLVVLERDENEMSFVVWMLEDAVTNSFTNLLEIYSPDAAIRSVYGFSKWFSFN